jgi:hypothetical protein
VADVRLQLEKVFKKATWWLDRRCPEVALSFIEDARYLFSNDGRRLKALDRYLDENFEADLLQRVLERVDRELGRISWWIKSCNFDDDLWWMTITGLRDAHALSTYEKRRFKREEPPLLAEALAGLAEASRGYRDPLYLKHAGKAGPLLSARIEAQRRAEREALLGKRTQSSED